MRTRLTLTARGGMRAALVGLALLLSASANASASTTVAQAPGAVLARPKGATARVTKPVPGLFDATAAHAPSGWWVGEESERHVVGFQPGRVSRARTESYETPRGPLQVAATFVPLQRSVRLDVATIQDTQADPSQQAFAYERLLNKLGVRRGGLRKLEIVAARKAIAQAASREELPEDEVRQALARLPAVAAARELLEKTGHRIVELKFSGIDVLKRRRPLDAKYASFVAFEVEFKVTSAKKPASELDGLETPGDVRFVGVDRDEASQPIVGDEVLKRTTYLRSDALSPISTQSQITRSYSVATRELVLDEAYRREQPSLVQHPGPNLIDGQGTPMTIWTTLRQMRQFGIPYGGLKTIRVPNVANDRAILDLAAIRAGTSSFDAEIRRTQTFDYIHTIATQSGHRIVSVDIVAAEGHGPRGDEIKRLAGDRLQNYQLVFHLEPTDPPSASPRKGIVAKQSAW